MQTKFESFSKMVNIQSRKERNCWEEEEKKKWMCYKLTVADRLQEVSMATGSTIAFLLENEPHAYAAATATFLAASLSFDVPLLPSPILSFFFVLSLCFSKLVLKLIVLLTLLAWSLCLWLCVPEATRKAGTDRCERERESEKETKGSAKFSNDQLLLP